MVLAGGCGDGKAGGPRVAAVEQKASPSRSAAAVVDRQLPLGATQEQIDRAYDGYYACWTAHGVPSTKDGGPLFDRFWRADPSRSRTTGGSGLGLPIARQLARAHGGDITVTSALGVGTTFTVRLPQ